MLLLKNISKSVILQACHHHFNFQKTSTGEPPPLVIRWKAVRSITGASGNNKTLFVFQKSLKQVFVGIPIGRSFEEKPPIRKIISPVLPVTTGIATKKTSLSCSLLDSTPIGFL